MVFPIVEASTAEELDIAFASAATQHADAIVPFGDTLTFRYATKMRRSRRSILCPRFISGRQFATNSGLISYGPDLANCFSVQAATLIRSSKAPSLPICR